jgi:hypothetical protein
MKESAAQKAQETARWARIMTKWLITRSWKHGAKWHPQGFEGPKGSESKGIVDLIAIRKDHREKPNGKRGDLFEIVLIQVKGGGASEPTEDDKDRLIAVRKFHRASAIVLSQWKRGKTLSFSRLVGRRWKPVAASEIFGHVPKQASLRIAAAKALGR